MLLLSLTRIYALSLLHNIGNDSSHPYLLMLGFPTPFVWFTPGRVLGIPGCFPIPWYWFTPGRLSGILGYPTLLTLVYFIPDWPSDVLLTDTETSCDNKSRGTTPSQDLEYDGYSRDRVRLSLWLQWTLPKLEVRFYKHNKATSQGTVGFYRNKIENTV